jgi:DNA-binding protein YbaB
MRRAAATIVPMDISEHPGAAGRRVQAEALRAGFERLVAQAPAIHAEALQVEVTRESWDGLVAATVGAQGELIALDLDPRVYRHPDARALADTIVETVRSATAAVRDRVVELFAPLVDEEQMRMHLDGDLEGVLDRLTQQLHGKE